MRIPPTVALAAVGVLCLVLAAVAVPALLDLTACSAAERRVFAEVPHVGGVRPQPSGNADAGSCMATYREVDFGERVVAHCQQALRSRGWTLQPPRTTGGSDVQGRSSGPARCTRGAETTPSPSCTRAGRPSGAVARTLPCTSPGSESTGAALAAGARVF